jgi:hypothetical protein
LICYYIVFNLGLFLIKLKKGIEPFFYRHEWYVLAN